jgi:hypothetical protein
MLEIYHIFPVCDVIRMRVAQGMRPKGPRSTQTVDAIPAIAKLPSRAKREEAAMKRYLIFAALAPPLGGFWVLLTTSVMSGYWGHAPSVSEAAKLFAVFARTVPYSYLFGILPALMLGAVDDILFHVKRIGWRVRLLLVGAVAFVMAELLYGSRGPDSGAVQFIMYGLVGFIPATISSWLSHERVEQPVAA